MFLCLDFKILALLLSFDSQVLVNSTAYLQLTHHLFDWLVQYSFNLLSRRRQIKSSLRNHLSLRGANLDNQKRGLNTVLPINRTNLAVIYWSSFSAVLCKVISRAGRFAIRIDSFTKSIRIDSEDRIETIKFRFATFGNAQLGWISVSYSNHICSLSVAWHFVFPFLFRNTCLSLVTFFVPPTNNSPNLSKQNLDIAIFAPLLYLSRLNFRVISSLSHLTAFRSSHKTYRSCTVVT